MNEKRDNEDLVFEADGKRYRDVPWPSGGRSVFGPWCLLSAWPALFGLIEKVPDDRADETERETQE